MEQIDSACRTDFHFHRMLLSTLPATLLLFGCSDPSPTLHEVTGTVIYDGKPLSQGMVMFSAKDGPPSKPSPIASDGSYRLNAAAGDYRVAVIANPNPTGPSGVELEGGAEAANLASVAPRIPEKYARHHSSGIEVTVGTDSPNKIDIELQ